MPADGWVCPPYRVRISARARRVNLRLSAHGELEVVLPKGVRRINIPELLFEQRDWLRAARERLSSAPERRPVRDIPTAIELHAIGARWTVLHEPASPASLRVDHDHLVVGGDGDTARELLRQWLLAQGRAHLGPWLADIGRQIGIDHRGLTIRTQRSRWGSCSSRGRINLNAALLFLPPVQVRHVLIHELCHRRHLNHSAAFWALVARHDPDYACTRAALREAWKHVPGWLTAATHHR